MAAAPHVLLVCYPSQGNVNPMLRLAKRLAAKGLLVTFSSTSDVGANMTKLGGAEEAGGCGVPLGLGRLRLEFLDDHSEDGDRITRLDDVLEHLESRGPPALRRLIRRQEEAGRPVACVVGNPFLPWATEVADAAGIPTAVLWVQSCAVFSIYYHHMKMQGLVDLDGRVVKLPGLPAMSAADVPSFLLPSASTTYKKVAENILRQLRSIHRLSSWVLVNSFSELERGVLDAFQGGVPLMPVGPLVELEEGGAVTVCVRGGDMADSCVVLRWLDAQAPRSVVYASLGSMCVLPAEALAEMAQGLASTGRPFLLAVRQGEGEGLPEGFLDSVAAGRGMVVAWSPQELVLAHPSTACFLTHCGWNSTLETLAAGVPVLAFPQWGDQCTDAKYLVDHFKTGVRLVAPLRRDAVRDAVDGVLAGPDAGAMLDNARAWSAAAKRAVAAGGSSDTHLQAFVDQLLARSAGHADRPIRND